MSILFYCIIGTAAQAACWCHNNKMHQGELGPRGLGITFHMIIISILRVTPVANLGLRMVDIMLHCNNVNTQQSELYNYQLTCSCLEVQKSTPLFWLSPTHSKENKTFYAFSFYQMINLDCCDPITKIWKANVLFKIWLQVVENWKYGGPCRDHRRERVKQLFNHGIFFSFLKLNEGWIHIESSKCVWPEVWE